MEGIDFGGNGGGNRVHFVLVIFRFVIFLAAFRIDSACFAVTHRPRKNHEPASGCGSVRRCSDPTSKVWLPSASGTASLARRQIELYVVETVHASVSSDFRRAVGKESIADMLGSASSRMITNAEGKGADVLASPNFNLPRINRISCRMA